MRKIGGLVTVFLVITLVAACFSANAAMKVATVQVIQPQQSGEGNITGTIYDKYNTPVDGAIVILFPKADILPSNIVRSVNGTYSFDSVPAGQYRVVATKPLVNGSGMTTLFAVPSGATVIRNVCLTHGFGGSGGNYSGENGTVAGTIYDENSAPINEAYVLLFAKGTFLPYTYNISVVDGSYEFTNVPPGQYRIIATKPLIDGSGSTTLFVVSPEATTIIDVYLNNLIGGGNQEVQGQQQQVVLKQQMLLSK